MNLSMEPVLFVGALLSLLYTCHGTVLSKVTKIALDSSRRLEAKRMKALYASFSNTRPFWVQLWNRTYGDSTYYRLDWQVRVKPQFGDGSIEVLNLSVSQYVTIVPAIHVLAIMNERIPGPLNGNYRDGAGVVLSLKDRDHMGLPLNRSIMFHFDNLRLPYHLPVTLCNQSGCPFELGILPTPSSPYTTIKPVARAASRLLTEEMLVGLITWNIVLTLLLFLVLLVLVFICADLEKRRKETARYGLEDTLSSISSAGSGGYTPGSAFPGGGALPGVLDYSMSHPGMVEIRDSDSDAPISAEAFEKMPSARF